MKNFTIIFYSILIFAVGLTSYNLYELKSQVERMEEFNQLWDAKIRTKYLTKKILGY